jgi:hypothetical protein
MNSLVRLGLLLACAAQAPAQAPASRLHAAWLREILDLDAAGAAADYLRIAADPAAPALDRQLAIARAYELRHLGVPVEPLPALDPVPEPLRAHFLASREPLPIVEEVLAAARGDGSALHQLLAREGSSLPPLRPLVPLILRQNRPSMAGETRLLAWNRAFEIVRAELDGRGDDAASLRAFAFPDWQSQPWPADHAAAWALVQRNLAQWLQERNLAPPVQALLQRLRTALEAASRNSPSEALRLLDRLPLCCERLRNGSER